MPVPCVAAAGGGAGHAVGNACGADCDSAEAPGCVMPTAATTASTTPTKILLPMRSPMAGLFPANVVAKLPGR